MVWFHWSFLTDARTSTLQSTTFPSFGSPKCLSITVPWDREPRNRIGGGHLGLEGGRQKVTLCGRNPLLCSALLSPMFSLKHFCASSIGNWFGNYFSFFCQMPCFEVWTIPGELPPILLARWCNEMTSSYSFLIHCLNVLNIHFHFWTEMFVCLLFDLHTVLPQRAQASERHIKTV